MNRNTRFGVVLLGVLLGGAATAALAHHSMSAKYDVGKTIAIEGTVTEVAWGNPHSWMFVDARPVNEPNAPVQNWIIEAPSAIRLTRVGWQKDTVQPGYKVTLNGHPHKQGKPELVLVELTDDHGHNFRPTIRLPYGEAGGSAAPSQSE